MIFLKLIFQFMSFIYFTHAYSKNRRYKHKLINLQITFLRNYEKYFLLNNLRVANRMYYVHPGKNLFKKNFQGYQEQRDRLAISLFRDFSMPNLFPGFRTIFNKKFLFDPLFNSHKDIIIRNIKTIQLVQKGNIVKSVVIFGASCLTIYAMAKLLLMLRKFFQNQYKMISEQEIKHLGTYENPHIEFKD
ncbi:conserved Plasmodium protein, unknown function [Plasmodium malariae]|uniref:Transmembrane protein n=1 Tax=Plasmodium malariae TaxID=5858 RepID=A0A1D3JN32_PLAMA|nr:conserved Plasmodium protein, unknown function [Plasmodium malariae]SBT87952.1 conserved Plasmodium protein, unknown function [Plasmodium malariae]